MPLHQNTAKDSRDRSLGVGRQAWAPALRPWDFPCFLPFHLFPLCKTRDGHRAQAGTRVLSHNDRYFPGRTPPPPGPRPSPDHPRPHSGSLHCTPKNYGLILTRGRCCSNSQGGYRSRPPPPPAVSPPKLSRHQRGAPPGCAWERGQAQAASMCCGGAGLLETGGPLRAPPPPHLRPQALAAAASTQRAAFWPSEAQASPASVTLWVALGSAPRAPWGWNKGEWAHGIAPLPYPPLPLCSVNQRQEKRTGGPQGNRDALPPCRSAKPCHGTRAEPGLGCTAGSRPGRV